MARHQTESLLSPYRVLDLTDEKGLFCGKLLADMGADVTIMGLGGYQYLNGDTDRAPVRISWPETFLHAGGEAASGTLMALYYREVSGEGQHVDVSAQACVVWILMNASPFPKLHGINVKRQGTAGQSGFAVMKNIWPCKDGYAYGGFAAGPRAASAFPAL